MQTIRNIDVAGKRVLVRCDFNVPLNEQGNILDDFRIQQTLPTIKYLIGRMAKVILMCHLGEPEGKVVPNLKTDKVAERLSEYLNFSVGKVDDCVGREIEDNSNNLTGGGVLMLENLRFHKEETEANTEFAKEISKLGDIYVNDAFGVCHRNNASITELPKLLPSYAGLLLEKEVITFENILNSPQKPMVAVVGGKKVETKAKFIDNISIVADYVIISGLIAQEVALKNIQFAFPDKIVQPTGDLGALDINDESIEIFKEKIAQAKTILWNGPFGRFEDVEYSKGTLAIAKAIIDSGAYSVVGGGETVEFLAKQGMIDKFSHVSTGGGAMLSYLAGENLPGLEALNARQ